MRKYFIGTYTNWCKEYCDKSFFKQLGELQGDSEVCVVDNTDPELYDYSYDLEALLDQHINGKPIYSFAFKKEKDHQFHYNVQNSALVVRQHFLNSNSEYLLLIESDVIPPVDLLARLDATIDKLPPEWGILGCLYYEGFHDYNKTGVHETHHALSGCTVYKREVIERYPFRISSENWAAFPDAWISHDVKKEGRFRIFNDHGIRCDHLHYQGASRQSQPI